MRSLHGRGGKGGVVPIKMTERELLATAFANRGMEP